MKGKLTHAQCTKATAAPGQRVCLADGIAGLRLNVTCGAKGIVRKSWSQHVTIKGQGRRTLGLGTFPAVPLSDARKVALRNFVAGQQGVDPQPAVAPTRKVPTVLEALAENINAKAAVGRFKDADQALKDALASVGNHASAIARRPVHKVQPAEVLAVLKQPSIAGTNKARVVLRHLRGAFDWAVAEGHRADNPAGAELRAAAPLAPKNTQHRDALPIDDTPGAMAAFSAAPKSEVWRAFVQLVVLTTLRSSEVRGARWGEVDFDARVWTVPGERMKEGEAHEVPLSDQATAILRSLKPADAHANALVFPGRVPGKPIANTGARDVRAALGLPKDAPVTLHGFRSTFRDWVAERTDHSRELAEMALAHKQAHGNAVEASYNRTKLRERRRALMQDWAAYVMP